MHTLFSRLSPAALIACAVLAFAPACGGVPPKASPDDPAGNFHEVSPGLYRGGRPDEVGVQRLAEMGVKTIVDLENDKGVIATERAWAEAAGLQFISEPMTGTSKPNDAEVDDTLAKVGDPALRPMFVHCMQGHDRTGVIIALYRVVFEGWTPKAAEKEMDDLGFNPLLLALHDYWEHKSGREN